MLLVRFGRRGRGRGHGGVEWRARAQVRSKARGFHY